jgi:hypothetical protein
VVEVCTGAVEMMFLEVESLVAKLANRQTPDETQSTRLFHSQLRTVLFLNDNVQVHCQVACKALKRRRASVGLVEFPTAHQ